MKAILFAAALSGAMACGISSAFACDMSQSMTDASCANMGFPNVFNNPPPAPMATPAPMAQNPIETYNNGPVLAYGIFGLFEDHPTMIYPTRPIICRKGLDCPGDVRETTEITPPPHHRRHHRHVTQAAQ